MKDPKLQRRSFLFLGAAAAARLIAEARPALAQPVQVKQASALGVSFYLTIVDLTDPQTLLTIGLPKNAIQANTLETPEGLDEPFPTLVTRYPAAVVANGTFFGKNIQKTVLGNLVGGGRFLKYNPWENQGTTLGLRQGNQPEMVTARVEGKPAWESHWFSITSGPRLVKQGKVALDPPGEGFKDPAVLAMADRAAIGFPPDRKHLYLVHFNTPLRLQKEAEVMQAIGCQEAMNLDGGASRALAVNGEILVPAGRNLTNVILIYDAQRPAPTELQDAWQRFQAGARPK